MGNFENIAGAMGGAYVTFTVWTADRQPGPNGSMLDPSYSDDANASTITGVIDEEMTKAYDLEGALIATRTATLMCDEVNGYLLADGMYLKDENSEVWRVTGKPIHYRAMIEHYEATLVWQPKPPTETVA